MTKDEFENKLKELNLEYEIIEFNETFGEVDFIVEFDFRDIERYGEKFKRFKEEFLKITNIYDEYLDDISFSNFPRFSMRYCNGFCFENYLNEEQSVDRNGFNIYKNYTKHIEEYFKIKLMEWKLR